MKLDISNSFMQQNRIKYNIILANYFSEQPLFFDGDLQKKPHIRKCVELPFQQTKAEMWDEVTDTLCNLDFIQAKACAKMTYDLVIDFNDVLEVIPDNAENIRQEKERQARLEKYTRDLIACANGKISRYELEVPKSVTLWQQKNIDTENIRIKENPNRLEKLKAFIVFLSVETVNLQNYSIDLPYFTIQQAWNFVEDGPVGRKATEKLNAEKRNRLLLRFGQTRPAFNPHPQVVRIFKGHKVNITTVSLTTDGLHAISGCNNPFYNYLILWDVETGQSLCHLQEQEHKHILDTSITPDGKRAVSVSQDSSIILWDLETAQPILKFNHPAAIYTVRITPDGKRAVSGSFDRSIILWDLETGQSIMTLKGHTDAVYALSITPDGKRALSGASDSLLILWDLETGNRLLTMKGHNSGISAVSITPDGKRAISTSFNNTLILWDLEIGQMLLTLKGHTSSITTVCMTPDGKWAVSGASNANTIDMSLILWDLEIGKVVRYFEGHTDGIGSVCITPDGRFALSGSYDTTLILWDLMSGNGTQNIKTNAYLGKTVSVSTDGKNALFYNANNLLSLWDLVTLQAIQIPEGYNGGKGPACITSDCKFAVSSSYNGTLTVWKLETGQSLRTFNRSQGNITAICLTPDSKYAICGCDGNNGKTLNKWDLESGQILWTSIGHTWRIGAVSITPDGKRVISCSDDLLLNNHYNLILWDMQTGRLIKILKGHIGHIWAVSITPDGKRAITGSKDYSLILWDLETGQALRSLLGHTGFVSSVCITLDGKVAVSGSWDRTLILWDLETGNKISYFTAGVYIQDVALFPGGLVVTGYWGEIFLIEIDWKLLCRGKGLVTATMIWSFEQHRYCGPFADCPFCGRRFNPSIGLINVIHDILKSNNIGPNDSACLKLPRTAWEDPWLLSNCPNCGAELKFNPFIAGGDNL